MKQLKLIIIIIIIIIFFLAQCKPYNKNIEQIDVTQNSTLVQCELVGEQLNEVQRKEEELGIKLNFQLLATYNYNFNNRTGKIYVEKIKDWGDPGDFHRIRIVESEKEYSFFNIYGWVKIGEYETQYVTNLTETRIINSEYISLQECSENEYLLFSFGYVYASQPGLFSIISFTNTPILVFNDKYHLCAFEDLNDNGIKDIEVTKLDVTETEKVGPNVKRFILKDGCYYPR